MALGTKIHGILDELIEHLDDQLRRAAHEAGLRGHLELEACPGKAVAVGAHGGDQQFAQIEIDALGLADALLDPRRRPQRAQD
jgi:hypothetical protein